MSESSLSKFIRLRGVRQNNLKNFNLDLPLGRFIVITGVSGSGKSSLAFDTLYAEGQRRYIETFSPYARQFFDRMDKPQVDSIEGIPPAIAIEQRNAVKSTRSTVGTMTEICDYMKMVWLHLAQLYCRNCGQPVRAESPQQIWSTLRTAAESSSVNESEVLITFELALSDKLSLAESLELVAKQGYQRLLLESNESARTGSSPEILDINEALKHFARERPQTLKIVQDRVRLVEQSRARFVEACEQAYHFGKGKLTIHAISERRVQRFSNRLHCASCDVEYRPATAALFSFNHPVGACASCRGFGRTIAIDYDLAIPDRTLSLAKGAVKPWQSGQSAECQQDMLKFCKIRKVPTNVPFGDLAPRWQQWVLDGDPEYGKDARHEWPHAWYGVKGYFRWLESKSYKMHVRVLLSRYRTYHTCRDCNGARFQPETLRFKVPLPDGRLVTLADFYQLPVRQARHVIGTLAATRRDRKLSDPLKLALGEVQSRLGYLDDVGLGYLTLDRPTRTLSGGETERVNLTTCLGSRMVNTLFVLDEPSVGLHARDTERLIGILHQLRQMGNTVVVVEHEPSVIRSADQIVDLGPGHGEAGGHLVYQGALEGIFQSETSLTGQYLSGRKEIRVPQRRPVAAECHKLQVRGARVHNLKNLTVAIPLERFVCITGVSGSGKTTLMREVLLPALQSQIGNPSVKKDKAVSHEQGKNDRGDSESEQAHLLSGVRPSPGAEVLKLDASSKPSIVPKRAEIAASGDGRTPLNAYEQACSDVVQSSIANITGAERLNRVVLVDQSSLGKTPRSNPAVYVGAFEDIREVFAQTELARQRGLKASAFSFNSSEGQCECCRGAGFEKVEMQFLSDVFIRCAECAGRRYRPHILEVKLGTPTLLSSADFAHESQSRSGRGQEIHLDSDESQSLLTSAATGHSERARTEYSIADLLEATIDQAIAFLADFVGSRHADRALQKLRVLQEVGLGYLKVGQPINTLSGGESQRLKLASHVAEFSQAEMREPQPTLFLFDEPTTGLHFDDVRVLLQVFQRLVDAGHSVLVIEHNLDVIKCADWLIDLGPEAGDDGGQIVVEGTPERVAACAASHTGRALRGGASRAAGDAPGSPAAILILGEPGRANRPR